MSNESRWRRSDFVIDVANDEPDYPASASGPMGAAPAAPEAPQLLGPDGQPASARDPLPFGFTA